MLLGETPVMRTEEGEENQHMADSLTCEKERRKKAAGRLAYPPSPNSGGRAGQRSAAGTMGFE